MLAILSSLELRIRRKGTATKLAGGDIINDAISDGVLGLWSREMVVDV